MRRLVRGRLIWRWFGCSWVARRFGRVRYLSTIRLIWFLLFDLLVLVVMCRLMVLVSSRVSKWAVRLAIRLSYRRYRALGHLFRWLKYALVIREFVMVIMRLIRLLRAMMVGFQLLRLSRLILLLILILNILIGRLSGRVISRRMLLLLILVLMFIGVLTGLLLPFRVLLYFDL